MSLRYQLIQEGDISTLGKDIAQTKFYDEDYGFIRPFNEFETMVDYYRQCGCTYGYIFAKREWNAIHITDTGTNTVKLNSLTNAQSSLDLFIEQSTRRMEDRAAELEITVDYYMEEFLDFEEEFLNVDDDLTTLQ